MNIRDADPSDFKALGELMVAVYSQLDGFPDINEQPEYYDMLANIGELTHKPHTHLLVAVSPNEKLLGGVVYFSNMISYGSGGAATQAKNASGIRLLAVDQSETGKGIGKALTQACIQRAKHDGNAQVILHTTDAMQIAWGLYERIGFERSPDLDFMQQQLPVFGFRLQL